MEECAKAWCQKAVWKNEVQCGWTLEGRMEEVLQDETVGRWGPDCIWPCMRAQSHPTLCNPVDCSLSGSSVHGILQARILKWVAISFSRASSQIRN